MIHFADHTLSHLSRTVLPFCTLRNVMKGMQPEFHEGNMCVILFSRLVAMSLLAVVFIVCDLDCLSNRCGARSAINAQQTGARPATA